MNGQKIHEELKKLDLTASKKAKVERLKTLLEDEGFAKVVQLAYSPRLVYGIGEKTLKVLRAWAAKPKSSHARGFGTAEVDLLLDIAARKVTGDAMVNTVKESLLFLDEGSAEVLLNILKKDLRAGFNVGYINEARSGFIEVTPYMRCALPKKAKPENWDWSEPHYVQVKADGMFANVIVTQRADGLQAEIRSRQGQVFPEAPFRALLAAAARTFDIDSVTHGEIVVWDEGAGSYLPREIGNGILNSMSNGSPCPAELKLVFLAWDQVPLESWVEKGENDAPYGIRLLALDRQIVNARVKFSDGYIQLIETKPVYSIAEAKDEFKKQLQQGNEGTVLKHRDGPWKDATSQYQVKFKAEFFVELRVKGFTEGNGKNATTFGAIEAESECGQLQTNIPGISDALRKEINEDREGWLNAIITVKANGVLYGDDAPTGNGPAASLYLPAFSERRTDRTTADDLDRILEIRDSVIEAM